MKWLYWAVAASILLFLAFTLLVKLAGKTRSNDELFAAYYKASEPINTRSPDEPPDDKEAACMRMYKDGNYPGAIFCLRDVLDKDPGNLEAQFFTGIAYIELEEYKTAIDDLKALTNNEDKNYSLPSLWYSGLCYLKLNQRDSALVFFNKLKTGESYFKSRAEKLVDELK